MIYMIILLIELIKVKVNQELRLINVSIALKRTLRKLSSLQRTLRSS